MNRRIKSNGRRGERNRRHDERLVRHGVEQQRLIEERQRRRKAALARILPRLQRFCPLSEIGVVAPRDGTSHDERRTFYSITGQVTGWLSGDRLSGASHKDWNAVDDLELERLAKIRRWDPIQPKDPLLILAEIADGQHESL